MTLGEMFVKFGVSVNKDSVNQVNQTLNQIKSTASNILGAIGLGISVKALYETAEEYKSINDSITQASRGLVKGQDAQGKLLSAAQSMGKSYSEMASSVNTLLGKGYTLDQAIAQVKRTNRVYTDQSVTIKKAITMIKDEFGLYLAELYEGSGISQNVGQTMLSVFRKVMEMLKKVTPYINNALTKMRDLLKQIKDRLQPVVTWVKDLTEKIGGLDKIVELLTVAVGIFAGFKVLQTMQSISKLLNPMYLKIAALVLIVEDFIGFMNGKDSLFGELLEAGGMDVEETRTMFSELWEQIKALVPLLLDLGKTLLTKVLQVVIKILPVLVELVAKLLPVIIQLINDLMPVFDKVVDVVFKIIDACLPIIDEIIPILINLIDKLLPMIVTIVEAVLPVVVDILDILLPVIQEILGFIAELIELLAPVIDFVLTLVSELLPVLLEVLNLISPILKLIFSILSPILDLLMDLVKVILKPIVEFLSSITEKLGPLFDKLQPVADVIKTIADGISSVASGVANGIGDFFGGIGDTVSGWFSGNATGTENSESTFLAGENGPELITGQKNKKVFTAFQTENILSAINGLSKASTAGVVNNSGRNVSQTVNITNNFSGDRNGQTDGAKAMDKSAKTATQYMANALVYGR